MFVNCELQGAPNDWEGTPRKRNSTALTVDIHNHFNVDAAAELMKEPAAARAKSKPGFPHFGPEIALETNRKQLERSHAKSRDPETRIKDMDAMGIDVQAVTPSPGQTYYWADADLAREASRIVNDTLTGLGHDHAGRFVAMGAVPLQDTGIAIAEMERCVDQLNMRGFILATNVDGEELSSPRLEAFFARAAELDVLLFLHPLGYTQPDRFYNHHFGNLIGNPLDTTVCLMHLIFDGTLARHPGLKVCAAHGGGFLGAYPARMDHGYHSRDDCRINLTEQPTTYLKQVYFDTMVFGTDQLEFLIDKYGAEHVLLGTDYAADMGETNPVGMVEAVDGISPEDRDAVCGLNAARLLRIERA